MKKIKIDQIERIMLKRLLESCLLSGNDLAFIQDIQLAEELSTAQYEWLEDLYDKHFVN